MRGRRNSLGNIVEIFRDFDDDDDDSRERERGRGESFATFM